MTLKITRFFEDAIKKQATISHFDYPITFNAPAKISKTWRNIIIEQFGELWLNDANYVVACKVADTPNVPPSPDGEEPPETEQAIIPPKVLKKFSELLSTVLGTDVSKEEIKTVGNDEKYLIVKITTK